MFRGKLKKIYLILSIVLISNLSVNAANAPDDFYSASYLQNQGHSKDAIRLVEIQKFRAENKELPVVDTRYKIGTWHLPQKPSAFLRHLIYEKDPTLYLNEFGTSEE